MSPDKQQWGPTTYIDSTAVAANNAAKPGINPEAVQGPASEVGHVAVDAAAGEYDHLFATGPESAAADAAAEDAFRQTNGLSAADKAAARAEVNKNIVLTRLYGPANFNPDALKK